MDIYCPEDIRGKIPERFPIMEPPHRRSSASSCPTSWVGLGHCPVFFTWFIGLSKFSYTPSSEKHHSEAERLTPILQCTRHLDPCFLVWGSGKEENTIVSTFYLFCVGAFDVDHFLKSSLNCYNTASAYCFGFLAVRHGL